MRSNAECRRKSSPRGRSQRGIALIYSLMAVVVLSLLAAGLIYVSNQETISAMNYKRQVQSVYASTAGVQAVLDWFRTVYAPYMDNQAGGSAGPSGTSPSCASCSGVSDTAGYDLSQMQPQYSSAAVTLGGTGANFPNSTIKTSFNSIRIPSSSIAIGTGAMTYTVTATLLKQELHTDVSGKNSVITERWQLSILGTIPNPTASLLPYSVQEGAIIERFFVPTYKDAIRGQCNVNINGNLGTDSYNSKSGAYNCGPTTTPACATVNDFTGADAGAGVGSNATLNLKGGSILVNGNAYYGQNSTTCPSSDHIPAGDIAGTTAEAPPVPFPPITPTFTTTTGGASACAPASFVVTTTALPTGTMNYSYTTNLTASGGTTPYSWAITSGSLPAGLTLSGNTISGTATVSGSFPLTIVATDTTSATASASLTLTIASPLTEVCIGSPCSFQLTDGKKSNAYSQTLAASGGNTPYSWALNTGSLPPGLTLSSAGVIGGTLGSTTGAYQFNAMVTDNNGWVANHDYCIQVTNSGGGKSCTPGGNSGSGGGAVTGGAGSTYYFSKPNTVATYYGGCTIQGATEVLCVPQGATTASYFFTDITIKGTGSLELRQGDSGGNCTYASPLCSAALTCAPVKLYVSNTMSLGGNGTAGAAKPGDLSVLYTGTNTTASGCGTDLCEYNGNSAFVGTIYAPSASCCIRGNTDFYGAVSAYNVDTGSSVSVHYDLALSTLSGFTTTFRIVNQTRTVF